MTTPSDHPDRPHPGRASSRTLQLIDLILSSRSPAAAIRALETQREELRRRWQDDLSLGEAGEIDQLLQELEVVLEDLRQVVFRRRSGLAGGQPPEDMEEPSPVQEANMPATPPSAVVLLSGGLDSATALAVARRDGFRCHALTIAYGQRHALEIDAARRVADSLGVSDHRIMQLDLRAFGGSALTADLPVPTGRSQEEMASGIPITYVPARNTIFLSLALAWAEVLGAFDLFIGVNAIDYSGYPDCRPEFVRAFERLANLATRAGVEGKGTFRIHTPLIDRSKADIIRLGGSLGVDYSLTLSCYNPGPEGAACGECDSCRLRRAGFEAAGVPDPTRYRLGP
jgi:7-cyano-7-deazaguanine synthase